MSLRNPFLQKSTQGRVFLRGVAALALCLSCMSSLTATPAPSAPVTTGKANNNDLAGLKLQFVSRLGEQAGYSLNLEAGNNNFRGAGTIGCALTDQDRMKFTAEYLQQKLGYQFSSGNLQKRDRHQEAVGLAYQRDLANVGKDWLTNLEASVTWAKAPGSGLDSFVSDPSIIHRHLAGSRLLGLAAGPSFKVWDNTALQVLLNYDMLTNERTLDARRHSNGFGFTLEFCQKLSDEFDLNLGAEFRRPYDSYNGSLNWKGLADGIVVGGFMAHTKGRVNLPNTTVFGLQISYSLGEKVAPSSSTTSIQAPASPDAIESWVSRPAVYEPQVLVSAEQTTETPPV